MIYQTTLPDILYGHAVPPEDSFLKDGNIFCVADGITRDPSSPKNFTKLPRVLKKYPNPSGARFVADIFCQTFVRTVRGKTPSIKNVEHAFHQGNCEIAKYNHQHIKKVDYLVNDYFGCVASAGVVYNCKLFWGGICDCGIIIYNKKGQVKFQTPNWMKDFHQYDDNHLQTKDFNYRLAKYRKVVRSQYRNKLNNISNGRCVSYGALTGEVEAQSFMHFGEVKLSKGDLIIFYSDGFEFVVREKRFFKTIYQKSESLTDQKFIPYSLTLAKKNRDKYGHERTLIAYIY